MAIRYNPAVLEPELLLAAYRRGIFPMAVSQRGDIGWFSPNPRGIIPLDERFHVPHGTSRALKQEKFAITFDQDFAAVMRECSIRREGTWISELIIESYCELHRLGYAHSVEARIENRLVGGLYGVHIGGAFFGESMFHRTPNASKVALVKLVERLRERGFTLLDTQWVTPHLATFGAHPISKREYLQRLEQALKLDCQF